MKEGLELYYFSGTGNTNFIVEYIVSRLSDKKVNIVKYRIEDTLRNMNKEKSKMFIFPINAQSTLPFIWKFLKQLPVGNGEKIFIVITLNESSAIASPLYKLFKKKGYNPVYYSEVCMPNNMISGTIDIENEKTRVKKALEKCNVIVEDMMIGKSKWTSEFEGSRIISFLSRNTNLPWFFMRLMFKLEVNTEVCIKCGLCEKECPIGNIKLNKEVRHNKKCEFCMRCAASCPQKAIYIRGKENYIIKKLGDKKNDL